MLTRMLVLLDECCEVSHSVPIRLSTKTTNALSSTKPSLLGLIFLRLVIHQTLRHSLRRRLPQPLLVVIDLD